MTDHGLGYWCTELIVIFLADVGAVFAGYYLLEGKLERRRSEQKKKHMLARLRVHAQEARSWVLSQRVAQGQRVLEYPAPLLGLDTLLNEAANWEFEQSTSLRDAATNLFVAIANWETFRTGNGWNVNTAGNRINSVGTRSDELFLVLGEAPPRLI